MTNQPIRIACQIFCLIVAFSSNARAGVDVCREPDMQSRLAVELVRFDDATFEQDPSTISRKETNVDLLFTAANDKYLFGAGHRYHIFDIEPLPVAFNGHVHTLFLPLHRVTGDERRKFRVAVAAALSASSNVFKNIGDFTSDAFQVLGAVTWIRQHSDTIGWRYGLCADHRFGDYRVYPTASVLWQPRPDWDVELGFPDSALRYRVSGSVSTALRVMPDGNEWFVLDRTLTSGSEFVYESYRVQLDFDWRFYNGFALNASVGRQLDNHYEMTLLDQSRITLSSDPATRVGVGIEWQF